MKVPGKAIAITDSIAAHRMAQRQAEKDLRDGRLSTYDRSECQRAIKLHEERIRALRKELLEVYPAPSVVRGRVVR